MKKKTMQEFPIPKEVFIDACNKTSAHFKSCADSWGEEERCHLRNLCGPQYRFIESDIVGKMAINFRKGGLLQAVNGGKTKRAMRKPSARYAAYLRSPHWVQFRVNVLKFWGYRCSICKSKHNLEVHHNNYDRLWHEELQDCIVVCRECHKTIHHKLPHLEDESMEGKDDSNKFQQGSHENRLF